MKSAAKSVNEFLGHLLSTVSGAAWMPAFIVVAGVAFNVQYFNEVDAEEGGSAPLVAALESLLSDSLAKYAIGLILVAAVALFFESFSFLSIRLLEGYWPTTFRPVRSWMRRRIRTFARRQKRLEDRRREVIGELVDAYVRNAAGSSKIDGFWAGRPALVKHFLVGGATPWLQDEMQEELESLDVYRVANEPTLAGELAGLDRRLKRFPECDRLLPTNLGNCLRSYEDRATDRLGEPMEDVVQRRHDDLPSSLRTEKDLLSESLRLHSAVTFACISVLFMAALLAFFGGDTSVADPEVWVPFMLYSCLVVLSYAGALAAADDYGDILVKAADALLDVDERSAEPWIEEADNEQDHQPPVQLQLAGVTTSA